MIQRVCSICKEEKDIEVFERNPQKPYGRGYRCLPCHRLKKRRDSVSKECKTCGISFLTTLSRQLFCSKECQNKQDKSGDWRYHFNSSLNKKRKDLTADLLLGLLKEQNYKCALTGVELTCIQRKGYVPTNASIDRIEAGGDYKIENIQLVCNAVNSFRRELSIKEYVNWCQLVVEAAGGRKGKK